MPAISRGDALMRDATGGMKRNGEVEREGHGAPRACCVFSREG